MKIFGHLGFGLTKGFKGLGLTKSFASLSPKPFKAFKHGAQACQCLPFRRGS